LLAVLWRLRHGHFWVQACGTALVVYLAILLPVLGFVPMSFMRFAMVADHFQYPALPALAALAGALAAGAIEYTQSRPLRPAVVAACCLLLIVLAGLTAQQCETFAEFKKALEIKPDFARAHYQFGLALAGRNQFDEAREHFKRGLDSALAENDKLLAAAIQAEIDKLSQE
jgi:tetratricopeptide (TPR) repeat protein